MYVGLDIGGTKFQVASANEKGEIIRRVRAETPLQLKAGLDLLHEMIEQVSDKEKISSIGVAIGGPLDPCSGVVSPLHQPEWRNVPLKEILESAYHCPCRIEVDTDAAALAEGAFGLDTATDKSAEISRLLYITLSTGMGGGFLVDGAIYRGFNGSHPEVAHQAILFHCDHPERILCECGNNDCLEALVSGNGIRRIYGKPASELSETEWEQVAYNVGQGLRNLAVIYVPERIMLGGGVVLGGGEALVNQVQEFLNSTCRLTPAPTVQLSRLGYDTALRGAIVLARKVSSVEN